MFFHNSIRNATLTLLATLGLFAAAAAAPGANQTSTTTPVTVGGNLPYQINLQRYDMGTTDMPTLHSFAAASFGGQWIIAAGLTNGLHGFDLDQSSIPERKQNRDLWLIDPVTKMSWHRGLDPLDVGSGLTESQVLSLTPANSQFEQVGDTLYMSGGYGDDNPYDDTSRGTFDALTAFHLPPLIDWIKGGAGTAAEHIRQINDPLFQVTGGDMYQTGGNMHLVFGQNYEGRYHGSLSGEYTKQVRSFSVQDDGTNLGFQHLQSTTPEDHFRRRDLNVFPAIQANPDSSLTEHLVALSGVFTESFGTWTVPVEIDSDGNPTQIDHGLDPLNTANVLDADPSVFKQGMNNYYSAKLGLFSEASGTMHEILFGGITLQEYDPTHVDADANGFVTDRFLPNTSQISSVVRLPDGSYEQHYLGAFPELLTPDNDLMRFGSNAEFFLADNVTTYPNGVIALDALTDTTTLGYIYGGLIANAPHVFNNPTGLSSASGEVFKVVLTPIPEPASIVLAFAAVVVTIFLSGRSRMIAGA